MHRSTAYLKLWLVLFLSFHPAFGLSAEDATTASNTVLLKRLSLRDLVSVLRFDEGIKVAFAETPAAYCSEITYRETLNWLRGIPPGERTKKEKAWLSAWEQTFPQTSDRLDASFPKQERYTLAIPRSVPTDLQKEKLLKTIATLDGRYVLRSVGSIHLLSDKDSIVNTDRISLKISNADANTAVNQLNEVISSKAIGIGWSSTSLANYKEVRITLNLENVTLAEAFSRFAEALGPTVSWELLEASNMKSLNFGKVGLVTQPWDNILVQ